jgi:competence CoiA-like predicted nuclease
VLLNHLRDRATPAYDRESRCPECDVYLRAKCGPIIVWHWAHKARSDCPAAGETEWHLGWKARFPSEWLERRYGGRRADVLLPSGEVIEFQRAGLDIDVIAARERACKWNISWVCNGTGLGPRFDLRFRSGSLYTFRWKHPAKTWLRVSGRLTLDLGERILFHIAKCGVRTPLGGYGYLDRQDWWTQEIVDEGRLPLAQRRLQRFVVGS